MAAEPHPNAVLVRRFYEALGRRDAAAMIVCYAADVRFSTLSLLKICSTCLQIVPVFAPRMMPIS